MKQRRRASMVIFTTTALAVAMLAAFPGAAHETETGPTAPVIFTGAWTNDDGLVDNGDAGDTGLPSSGFDIWPANESSDDPETAGVFATRRSDDAARCIAVIREGPSGHVDMTIDNGYPQYVCTVTVEVTNGASVPASLSAPEIVADDGLEVTDVTDPPAPLILGPEESIQLDYAIRILNAAPQNAQLSLTISLAATNPACGDAVVFGVESDTGDIYEIDISAGLAYLLADIVDPVPTNVNSPNGLAYDGSTNRLYFSASLEGASTSGLYFWDGTATTSAGSVTGQVAGGAFFDGDFHYVINETDDLARVSFNPNGTVASEAIVHAGFAGTDTFRFGDVAITADGSTLYGSTLQSGATSPTFFSLDLATGAYTAISTTDGIKLQLAFGDDGALYGQSTGTGEFFEINPATGATTPAGTATGATDGFTDLASGLCVPEWSPDPRIVFSRHVPPDGEIHVMDSNGLNRVIFYDDPLNEGETFPAWSPDGTQIAVVSNQTSIKTMPATGGTSRTLITEDARHPDWSPDSTLIAFHADRSSPQGTNEVYVIPTGGGTATRLTDNGKQPDWSADGSRILFSTIRGSDPWQIYSMASDGSDPLRISNSTYSEEWPDWSPDGSRIVFTRDIHGLGKQIYVMDSDGSNVIQLTNLAGSHEQPHWSPDGSRIVYSRSSTIYVMDADGTNIADLGPGVDPAWEQIGH